MGQGKYIYVSNKVEEDDIRKYEEVDLSSLKKVSVWGMDFWLGEYLQYLKMIINMVSNKEKGLVFWMNHTLINNISSLYEKVKERDNILLFLKGYFVNRAFRKKTGHNFLEVSETAFLYDILHIGDKKGWSFFFLGEEQEVLDRFLMNIRRTLPNIKVVGKLADTVSKISSDVITGIRKLSPNIVIVGLEYIKQERWALENFYNFGHSVIILSSECFEYMLRGEEKKERYKGFLSGLFFLWRFS
jgi:UDP-N-acetyl-D-mannosaminuronic acid transferase (WecB/TagA/CpsF family)